MGNTQGSPATTNDSDSAAYCCSFFSARETRQYSANETTVQKRDKYKEQQAKSRSRSRQVRKERVSFDDYELFTTQ